MGDNKVCSQVQLFLVSLHYLKLNIFLSTNFETKTDVVSNSDWVSSDYNFVVRGMEVLHQENWTTEVTTSLKRFEKQLIIAMKEKGWDGKEDETRSCGLLQELFSIPSLSSQL